MAPPANAVMAPPANAVMKRPAGRGLVHGPTKKARPIATPWILTSALKMKGNSLFSGRWAAAGLSESDCDEIYARFVALDANGDGKISRSEFQDATHLLEFLGMSTDDIGHLFAVVDADHSGHVDWEEFLYYMSVRKDHSPLAMQKDPEMKRLDANIQKLGFVLCTTDDGLRGVAGDGNCQFYSLSWKLRTTTLQGADLRARIIKYLREAATRATVGRSYEQIRDPTKPRTFNAYLNKMARDAEFGDEITLQAAADVFQVQVNLLTSSVYDASKLPGEGGAFGAVQIVKPARDDANATIWLAFAAQHYSPIDPTASTPAALLQLQHDVR